jgi:hypothetical protein
MFFLWREAAGPAFIVTPMATASQMDRARARQAIVLVHMAADVCQRDITLHRLPGMGRPPRRRRPEAIPDTLHRKILLRRRHQGDTRLRPGLKRVHLQASEWGQLCL